MAVDCVERGTLTAAEPAVVGDDAVKHNAERRREAVWESAVFSAVA